MASIFAQKTFSHIHRLEKPKHIVNLNNPNSRTTEMDSQASRVSV